jgi:hypothetical protein
MIAWQEHLSWSHATALVICAVLLVALFVRAVRALLAERTPPARRPLPTVDYSAQYQQKVRQLGSRYLFHTPINRRRA